MDKKSLATGVAAVALATGLAVAPAVTEVDTEPEAIVEEVAVEEVTEEATEEVTEEISETEKETGESTEEPTDPVGAIHESPELKLPGEHQEVEPPNYEDYTLEIPYSFKDGSDRTKTLIIDVPDELSIDIATLYVNDAEVATALLPTDAKFTSIPVVFEDLENLEIKLYRMGEEIGTARFINGILLTNAKAVE